MSDYESSKPAGELFGWAEQERPPKPTPPIARTSDPVTSHMGASHVTSKLTETQARFVAILRRCNRPMTAEEVADEPEHMDASARITLRKRAKECLDKGAIVVVGRRKCRITGNAARVFVPKPQDSRKVQESAT